MPAVLEVFELLAEHDLTLAMGHSSPGEVLRLLPEAKRLGVPRILVTHVFGQDATREQMRQMADEGAIMEIDWLAVYSGGLTIEDYVAAIRDLGAEAFFMSSDLGQEGNPVHPDGLRDYIRAMLDAGITEAERSTACSGWIPGRYPARTRPALGRVLLTPLKVRSEPVKVVSVFAGHLVLDPPHFL